MADKEVERIDQNTASGDDSIKESNFSILCLLI